MNKAKEHNHRRIETENDHVMADKSHWKGGLIFTLPFWLLLLYLILA